MQNSVKDWIANFYILMLLSVCLFIPHGTACSAEANVSRNRVHETWEIIFIGQNRIGYSNTTIDKVTLNSSSYLETSRVTFLKIKRFGQDLQMTSSIRTKESDTGELMEFDYEVKNPPAKPTSMTGVVSEGRIEMVSIVNGQRFVKKDLWKEGTKSPAYQEYVLLNRKIEPGNSLHFNAFIPEYNKVSNISISAGNVRKTTLLDNDKRELISLKITQSVLPTMPMQAYADQNGNILKTEMNFLGQKMVTYQVPKEVALEAISGEELDLAVGTLVRVHQIPNAHKTKKMVYEVASKGGEPAEILINDETQTVEKTGEGQALVTVSQIEIKPVRHRIKADREYLDSSSYIQTKDPRIRELAHRVNGSGVDPLRVAYQLEKFVHDKVKEKNFSTALASAAEVAQSLQGDCTEHAVLLAALLRVKRIPSRIVVGMVYSERNQAFVGHMWTEALVGDQWIPLDATMGQGGIGAAHIKMGVTSFSDEGPAPITAFLPLHQILGNMEIRVVSTE